MSLLLSPKKPRRGPRHGTTQQFDLFGPPPSALGSPTLFTVTIDARRPDGSALPWRYRAVVDARGAVHLWQSTGARARAVEGWKGRWQDMGVDFWWHGLHDNDFEELAQVIWSQLRAISPGQVIDDARPGWHRTSPGPTAEERYDAFVARGARMIHGVLQLPSSEGGAT